MDNIGLKKKYSSSKMDNITVIKLKTLAKQINEQVLIPGLEIPRNTTRYVTTCAILDDPILGDKIPFLQPTQHFIAKSIHKMKDFGNWLLDCIPPKPKVVDEALESFKNLTTTLYNKRDTFFQL